MQIKVKILSDLLKNLPSHGSAGSAGLDLSACIPRKIQLNPNYKKKKSHFIIKNTFTKIPVKKSIRRILNEIL